jgi:hypothetical protein
VSTHHPGVGTTGQVVLSVSCDPQVESTAPNLIDISKLSASAAGLLKQLLASMPDKEDPKEESQTVAAAKVDVK